jgi:hypothetical protein
MFVIFIARRTVTELNKQSEVLSARTKSMQMQISRTLIVQVSFKNIADRCF